MSAIINPASIHGNGGRTNTIASVLLLSRSTPNRHTTSLISSPLAGTVSAVLVNALLTLEMGVKTMTTHIVQFDKTFHSGTLNGLTVVGQCISFPSYKTAQREAAYLERMMRRQDFAREYATGAKFTVSNVQLFPA